MRTNITVPCGEITVHAKQRVSVRRPSQAFQFHIHAWASLGALSVLCSISEFMLKREKRSSRNTATRALMTISDKQLFTKDSVVLSGPSGANRPIEVCVSALEVIFVARQLNFFRIGLRITKALLFQPFSVRNVILGVVDPQAHFTSPRAAIDFVSRLGVKIAQRLGRITGSAVLGLGHS